MAEKRLDRVEIQIIKDIATGETQARCQAVCFSPDIGASFGVSLGLDGTDELANQAVEALKIQLSDNGKHEVTEASPPPTPPEDEGSEG